MSNERVDHGRLSAIFAWLRTANQKLNHDFCPSANRWVNWLKNPFWCLVLALTSSIACGFLLKPEAFALSAILLLIMGVGVLFPWLTMRGVDGHVTFDVRRGRVGQPVIVRLRIRNRWPWPVWGVSVVKGFAWRDSADTSEGVSLARILGWSTADYSWQFVPVRRGHYPLAAPEIETGFPFGLYRASCRTGVDGHLVVWPQTVTLQGMPDCSASSHADDRLADRRTGEFGDLMGTRLFRSGDSLRRVHWAQTARQQTLIVCERQAPALSSVRVMLDLTPGSHAGFPDPKSVHTGHWPAESVELCVRTAASVCESLHRQHARVELLVGDQLLVAGDSAAGLHRLMNVLAVAEPSSTPAFTSIPRVRDGMFSIVVTTAAGLQQWRAQLHGHQVIAVTEGRTTANGEEAIPAWITVNGEAGIQSELPRSWKAACHAG